MICRSPIDENKKEIKKYGGLYKRVDVDHTETGLPDVQVGEDAFGDDQASPVAAPIVAAPDNEVEMD